MGPPVPFFVLVLLLGVPFWVFGGADTGFGLPVGSLQALLPAIVATMLAWRDDGRSGVRAMWGQAFDTARVRPRWWFAVAIGLMPAVLLCAYASMRLAGHGLPPGRPSPTMLAIAACVFFVGATFEEIGWTGYAAAPAQARWGTLGAGMAIGSVWALWHVALWSGQHGWAWTAWQCAFTVAARVVMVWLWHRTDSVLAPLLTHTTINVGYLAFPAQGSGYDPAFAAPFAIAGACVVAWRARTGAHEAR
ncbi:MAG: CPBP family glutamic-type intramembrane protease [Segniliparus sp.]|uniref:CPBP family glutamic-type intramembrane protease n=1 Tax=Segniliparus sp. TaxID=2804064 RepID=UPI003F3E8C3B